eukprot:2867444-Rhodomonas_salina.3
MVALRKLATLRLLLPHARSSCSGSHHPSLVTRIAAAQPEAHSAQPRGAGWVLEPELRRACEPESYGEPSPELLPVLDWEGVWSMSA